MWINDYWPAATGLFNEAGDAMSLRGVQAEGRVNGLLLDMSVRQRYRNDTNETLETVYTFPLAYGAVLLGLDVELGGKRLSGVVLARQQAEADYEKAIAEGDSPVMLEQSADGLFTANLGNLKPGEEAVIEYRYAQLLRYEQGRIRLSVPTTIAPRYGDAATQGGLRPHAVAEASLLAEYPFDLTLTLAGDLAMGTVESPSHAIRTRCQGKALVVSLARDGFLDRDFVLTVDGLAGRSLAAIAPDVEGGHVMLAGFCPSLGSTARAAVDLKILVDCSGSMGGDSIGSARTALHRVLAELNPEDRLSYSRFGSTVAHGFNRLVPASPENLRAASVMVGRTDADMGGTEIQAALQAVFALGGQGADVLLITDGEVWNIEATIEAARRSGHRIFAVGVGSAPAETLLRDLAEATGGACELAAPNEDIEATIVRMFRRIRVPGASELRIDWPVRPSWVTPLPSALFDGETVHVFAGFDAVPFAPPVLSFSMGGGERFSCGAGDVERIEGDALPRLSASERIRHAAGDEGAALALRYRLVTRWTSFFLVHERAEGDKATDLPRLQKVTTMLAAGWGGSATVLRSTRRSGALYSMSASLPAAAEGRGVFSAISEDLADFSLDGYAEIEDDAGHVAKTVVAAGAFRRAELVADAEALLAVVNDRVAQPDDLARNTGLLVAALKGWPALRAVFESFESAAGRDTAAWVALVRWADRQVRPEHGLTRHAARAIAALVQRIGQDHIDVLVDMIEERAREMCGEPEPPDVVGAAATPPADRARDLSPVTHVEVAPMLKEAIRQAVEKH
jgi:Ca-activated chloride channel family protein